MPRLRQLECHIELVGSNLKLKEYNTSYVDGFVETFVAIPDQPTGFSVHLTSHGYIAPGLSMFVYIDGVYQCNRNRRGLIIPDDTKSLKHTEVDFRVRQKEEKQEDGRFIGREWSFEKLNIVSADTAPDINPDVLGNVGTIEVVVLRCQDHPADCFRPRVNAKGKTEQEVAPRRPSVATSVKAAHAEGDQDDYGFVGDMGGIFDGSSDDPRMEQRRFTLDGHYTEHVPSYSYGQGSYDEQPPPPNLSNAHPQYVSARGMNPLQDPYFYERVPPLGYYKVYEVPHGRYEGQAHATHYGPIVPPPPHQSSWQGHEPSFEHYHRDWHPNMYYGPPPPPSSLHYDVLPRRRDSSPESYSSYFVASSPEQRYGRVDLRSDSTIGSAIPRSYPRAPEPPPNLARHPSNGNRGRRGDAPLEGLEDAFKRHGYEHTQHTAPDDRTSGGYSGHNAYRGHPRSVCDVDDEGEVYHSKGYCQRHCSERSRDRRSSVDNPATDGRKSSSSHQNAGSRTVSWDLNRESSEGSSYGARARRYPSGEKMRDLQVARHSSRQSQPATSEMHSNFGRHNTRHSLQGRNDDSRQDFSRSTNISNINTRNKHRTTSGERDKSSSTWNPNSTAAINETIDRSDWSWPEVNAKNSRCEEGKEPESLNCQDSSADKGDLVEGDESGLVKCDECEEPFTGDYWNCEICNDGDYDLCAACYDKGARCPVEGHVLAKKWLEEIDTGTGENESGPADQNDWNRTNENCDSKNDNAEDHTQGCKDSGATGSWDSSGNQNDDSGGWQETTNNNQTSGNATDWDGQGSRVTNGDHDRDNTMYWGGSTGQENSNNEDDKNESTNEWNWSGTGTGNNSNDSNGQADWNTDENAKAGGESWDASGQADSSAQQDKSDPNWGDNDSYNKDGKSWEAAGNNDTNGQAAQGGGNTSDRYDITKEDNQPVSTPSKPNEATNSLGSSSEGPTVRMRGGAGSTASPEETYIKPYWTNWKTRPKKHEDTAKAGRDRSEEVYVAPEEPLHTILQSAAQERKVEHQVRAGRGVVYEHKVGKPMYIDRMDQPYAVFRFKYRSKEMLQKILDIKIEEDENDLKQRLRTMTRDQIIEELLRARATSSAGAPTTEPGSNDKAKGTTGNANMPWERRSQTGEATRKLSQSKQSSSHRPTSAKNRDDADKQNVNDQKTDGWDKSDTIPGGWNNDTTPQQNDSSNAGNKGWDSSGEDSALQGAQW